MNTISYRRADVDGLKVFYRQAGRADAPTLVLLHTGHFALETHCDEIAAAMHEFLDHRQVN